LGDGTGGFLVDEGRITYEKFLARMNYNVVIRSQPLVKKKKPQAPKCLPVIAVYRALKAIVGIVLFLNAKFLLFFIIVYT